MFGNPHFARVRQSFADQFEQDRSAVFYRKSLKGPPIRVTQAERDSYVSAFNRRLRWMAWSLLPATVVLIVGLALLVPDVDSLSGEAAVYGGLALIILTFMGGFFWAWYAPARELSGRPAEGVARSRDEIRRLGFSRMTYGQLGVAVLGVAALIWKVSLDQDILHGWGVLWLVFGATLTLVAGVQALRKWLYERR